MEFRKTAVLVVLSVVVLVALQFCLYKAGLVGRDFLTIHVEIGATTSSTAAADKPSDDKCDGGER